MMQETYNSCMNETVLQKVGVAPLVSLIDQVAASFPVAEGGSGDEPVQESDYTALSDTILLLEKIGVGSLVGLSVGADDKNPDVVIVQAYPAGLTLPSPEYYQDNDTIATYQAMLGEVFGALLPSNSSKASAKQLAQSVIDFEKKVAEITPPPEDQSDVTVGEYFDLCQFLSKLTTLEIL